jgi:pimeloyl-ACP methyl ester carboxylesterase
MVKIAMTMLLVTSLLAVFRPPSVAAGERGHVEGRGEAAYETGFVEANGITIAYESFGSQDRETVLLIGGTGEQLIDFPIELVEALLQRGYRVVRYDNRDAGLSTKFDAAGYPDPNAIGQALAEGRPAPLPYTLRDMAEDAVGLLDALGIPQAHLAGASMGGNIAQLVAIDYPDRVLSLTTMGSDSGNPALPVVARPEVFEAIPIAAEGDVPGFIEYLVQWRQALSSPSYPADPRALRASVERGVERAYEPDGLTRQATATLVGHLQQPAYRNTNLHRITAPTVVVQGAEDPLQPLESAHDLVNNIPDAELVIVPGMGHDLPVPLVPVVADAIASAACRAESTSS